MKKFCLFILLFIITTKSIFAGGGNYGFQILQQGIAIHVPFKVEITVYDWEARGVTKYTDGSGNPVAANEEFRVITHAESEGDRCEPTIGKTSTSGKFIIICYSNQQGRLTYHLEPVNRTDLGNSIEQNLEFSPAYVYVSPTSILPPTATPKPTTIPTRVIVPSVQPTQLVPTVKPTTVIKTIATISSELTVSPTPSPVPIINDEFVAEIESVKDDRWQYLILLIVLPLLVTGIFLLLKKLRKSQKMQSADKQPSPKEDSSLVQNTKTNLIKPEEDLSNDHSIPHQPKI